MKWVHPAFIAALTLCVFSPLSRADEKHPEIIKFFNANDLTRWVSSARSGPREVAPLRPGVVRMPGITQEQMFNRMQNATIGVRGTVEQIGKDTINNPYITFTPADKSDVVTVQCIFTKDDVREIDGIRPGQSIVIGGTCLGFPRDGNVLMKKCWIYDEKSRCWKKNSKKPN